MNSWPSRGFGVLTAATLLAQEPAPPGRQKPEEQPKQEEPYRIQEEITVESASKVEQKLVDAPATLSVVTSETLAAQPAQNMADTLRAVPGTNVIQMSARDINLTTRQATSTLATSQLRLGRRPLGVPGLLRPRPVGLRAVSDLGGDQADRGRARPGLGRLGRQRRERRGQHHHQDAARERGLRPRPGAGLFNRDGGSREAEGNGYQFNGSFSYANALNDTWSYRLQAGYFNSEPYSRPMGSVPVDCHPLGVVPCRGRARGGRPRRRPDRRRASPPTPTSRGRSRTTAPASPSSTCASTRTSSNGGRITYQGGYAGTAGIVHTGIGPFGLQSGSYLAYGRVSYNKGALRISAFGNFVDAQAPTCS